MPGEDNGFNATQYKNGFTKEKYDRVSLVLLHKGDKDRLKAHAESCKMSLNEWINQAIAEKLERETRT